MPGLFRVQHSDDGWHHLRRLHERHKVKSWVRGTWASNFHEYLGGTIRGLGGIALRVGGVEDHVHALIGLKTTHCVADFVRELKKATTNWATRRLEPAFGWQEGYAIFSVSVSALVV